MRRNLLYRCFFLCVLLALPVQMTAYAYCDPIFEFEADYLLAWRKGRDIPPIITTAPAGVNPNLATSGTRVVFGHGNTGDSPQSGFETTLSYWFCDQTAFRLGGLWVNEEVNSASITSDAVGVPSIGLPYYSTFTNAEAATTIALENEFSGNASAKASNKVWGAHAMLQWSCTECYAYRLNFFAGYQHYQIKDSVQLEAFSNFLLLVNTAAIDNRFDAKNTFNGGALGVSFENYRKCWNLTLAASLALGEMDSTVSVKGSGVISPATGQLVGYVQDSNRGTYKTSFFAVVPEASAKVSYQLNRQFCLDVGYRVIYWSDLYLAGEQIDRRLNPFAASSYPEFLDKKSTFWLQGVTVGVHYTF